MSQPSVLIIADQSGFGRDLVSHWQMERDVPAFTVMSSELWVARPAKHCDLAIVDGRQLAETRLAGILDGLERADTATVCVLANEARFHSVRSQFPRVMPIRHSDEWVGTVVVLGAEVLRRSNALPGLVSDHNAAANSAHAALGKFMLDSRHAFNNALTSVLGNAELLMLTNGDLPADMREQVETIHAMALRLHEMMQRFSSLEVEMQFAERHTPLVGALHPRAAGSRELREEDPDLR